MYYHRKVSWARPREYFEFFELPEEIRPLFINSMLEVEVLTEVDDEVLLEGFEFYMVLCGFLWVQKNVEPEGLEPSTS